MGVILPGVERDFPPVFSWDWDGKRLGVDRLSAWPIIGADIKHFTDYRYRPF